MKKLSVLLMCTLLTATALHAQKRTSDAKDKKETNDRLDRGEEQALVKNFIGTTGIFKGAYGVLGLQFSTNVINPKVYATAGFGASLAGVKFGADLQHFSKPNRRGFAYGAGLAYVAGKTGSTNVTDVNTGITYISTQRNALVLNTFLGSHFKLSRKSTFYIQTGYGIPTNKVYSISNFSGSAQDLSAAKAGLALLAPHGFMTGIGFMFGL
jgi:hypothetical protein